VKRPPGGTTDESGVVSNQAKEIFERGMSVMGSSENVSFSGPDAF
jgi:hypothetical protein